MLHQSIGSDRGSFGTRQDKDSSNFHKWHWLRTTKVVDEQRSIACVISPPCRPCDCFKFNSLIEWKIMKVRVYTWIRQSKSLYSRFLNHLHGWRSRIEYLDALRSSNIPQSWCILVIWHYRQEKVEGYIIVVVKPKSKPQQDDDPYMRSLRKCTTFWLLLWIVLSLVSRSRMYFNA